MAPCPICRTELTYVQQYGQWYCTKCRRYPQPSYPRRNTRQTYPPTVPPPNDESSRKLVIIIVVVVVILVLMTIIPRIILYFWVMDLADTGEEISKFPTIEITLTDSSNADSLNIKHTAGDPLDWSDYKMIITNQSDTSDTAIMNSLSGVITAGEVKTFTSEGTAGFSSINYQRTKAYSIEIFNIEENKLVWQKKNVICV
jgi:hypothetical protein